MDSRDSSTDIAPGHRASEDKDGRASRKAGCDSGCMGCSRDRRLMGGVQGTPQSRWLPRVARSSVRERGGGGLPAGEMDELSQPRTLQTYPIGDRSRRPRVGVADAGTNERPDLSFLLFPSSMCPSAVSAPPYSATGSARCIRVRAMGEQQPSSYSATENTNTSTNAIAARAPTYALFESHRLARSPCRSPRARIPHTLLSARLIRLYPS
ncbi:hypothetical protein C8Q77DRAFT_744774 [Trametes polyzona]|nr:hypothetical protein C8Q77DRAFT_744774 [Trametes polyzona]